MAARNSYPTMARLTMTNIKSLVKSDEYTYLLLQDIKKAFEEIDKLRADLKESETNNAPGI